jgi:CheY-like chemotaxis protein
VDKGAAKARVLVMDDDAMVREIAATLIRGLGYEVKACDDGRQALTMYEEALRQGTPYDVVLMDLLVPGGMGGEETVKSLLALDPRAKAIVCSGDPTLAIMENCHEFGFYCALPKPYTMDVLARTLEDVVGG